MKVLVTAKALDLDRTSEGICTTKFLYCLLTAGFQVVCLAPASAVAPEVLRHHGQWLRQIKLIPIENISPRNGQPDPEQNAPRGKVHPARVWLRNKCGALSAYTTGFSLETWAEVRLWRRAIRKSLASEGPDIVFVRGAGLGFEPHLAMAGLRPLVPWIANYHDPFPVSRYPEPYRRRFFLISKMQERWNARIVTNSDAVSFPSLRLLEFMLRDELASYQRKGVVIPHIIGSIPQASVKREGAEVEIGAGRFVILHAGTLLGPREPWGLLEAFHRFLAKDPARAANAELLLVGKVNCCHKADPRWLQMTRTPRIRVVENRVSYPDSLDLLSKASVAVVLEAEAAESPFFPAKLTDYMLQGKPILALSPVKSVVSDILGSAYPYRALPCETVRIEEILERLWTLWQKGDLAQAAAPREVAGRFSVEAVGESCKRVFARCLDVSERFSKRRLAPQ
jgi:hypothetical protein